MKLSRRHNRVARKLALPMIAIALMTTMMYLGSASQTRSTSPAAPAAVDVVGVNPR